MDVAEKVLAGGPWPGVTLVQVTLIAALGVLAWLAVRRGGPALRGAVVLAALVGLLVVPALATIAPVWFPLPTFTHSAPTPEPTRPREVVRAPVPQPPARPAVPPVVSTKLASKPAPLPDDIIDPVEESPPQEALEMAAVVPPPAAAAPATEPGQPRRAAPSAGSLLVSVWLVGAALYLARALISLALLYRCAWLARPIRDAEWADCLNSLPDQDGRPRVALRESSAIGSPLTLGLFRSVILLPVGWRDWSAEQLRLVLAHELSHVRRRDFLAGLAAELAVCLCWFHPLVRWLAGRLRLEQEYVADGRAASAAGDAMAYVRCLARLALEQGAGRRSPAPALWRRRPEILRRIDMLRQNRDGLPSPLKWRTASAVVALAAVACVTVAGIGPLRAIAVGAERPDADPVAKPPADVQGDRLPAGAVARLGTTRWRHGSTIHYMAFGPEDKTLVTAGQDNTVRLWDMTTGQEIRRFARPVPEARPPVGARERLDRARLELEAAARQRALLGGGGGGFGVALSPDGKTLAVAGVNVVQLYETATGKELGKINTPPTGMAGLLFSPDAKTLAGRGTDGALTLWDTTGKERHQLKAPPRPENNRVVVAASRFGGDAPGMAFTPDGTGFVAATQEFKEQNVTGRITLWDVTSGKELRHVKMVENAAVGGVAVAPGGKVIAYCSAGIVHACRADTGDALFQTKLAEPASGVTFSPDGKRLAVRGVTQQVRVLDAETGKELFLLGDPPGGRVIGGGSVAFAGPIAVAPEVRNLAFTSDGKRVATAAGGTIRMWAAATGKEVPLSDGHLGPVTAAVLSADGKVVVSWGADRTIRRWDAATGKPLGVFPVPPAALATAVSADGGTVAAAGADGMIRLHDTNGGKEVAQFKGYPRGVTALAFSPDGKVLAERGGDAVLRVYDLAKGGEARQFAGQPAPGPVSTGAVVALPRYPGGAGAALVFSPDGKLLATAGAASPAVYASPAAVDRRVRPTFTISLIDVSTGKAIRKIEPTVPVVGYAFSPDGRVLATENADESVSLWEVASGKERARLGQGAAPAAPTAPAVSAPPAAVRVVGVAPGVADAGTSATLAFSPDGRALVGRGPDRSVRVWDVNGGKEVGRFKGHDGRVETVGFSPDGKAVVTGSSDTTMLLWDAAALRKDLPARQVAELPDGATDALWDDLAGDAGKAGQGVLKLAAAPGRAVPFLGERLKPADAIDEQKLDQWLADLESDRFAVRQEAIASLRKAGEQAVPALQKVLASQPPLETRLRVEELLDKLTGGTLTAEQLRLVRAVETLEKVGTPEARAVLRTLAGGAPGALPTREAHAALSRLGGR